MKKKYIVVLTTSCILLIGVISLLCVPNKTKSELYTGNPTVFVHGYKGTSNSFGYMLDRFENEYGWGNKGLVYYVSSEGRIRDYNLSKGKTAPTFVQVIFEDNRASFEDTTHWLSNVVSHMKENYSIDKVNLVGHSMGGIVSLKFIQDYEGEQYSKVSKFIAIGSPFDGIYSQEYFQIHHDEAATDLKPDSLALELLRKKTIPDHLDVLNIGSTGDTVAMPESVQALKKIVPINQYDEIIIENEELGHSALHENKQVDKIVYSFLWQGDRQ